MALFTVAEARAFRIAGERPLEDDQKYEDADVTSTEATINEDFVQICGVAFEPTEATVSLNGSGKADLVLPHSRIGEVSAISVEGTALSVSELADVETLPYGVLWRSGGWIAGRNNVLVTYEHGYEAVPKRIKWAALVVAVEELTGSDITSKAISQSDELGTYRLSYADSDKDHWYGIPVIDAILQRYAERKPGIG